MFGELRQVKIDKPGKMTTTMNGLIIHCESWAPLIFATTLSPGLPMTGESGNADSIKAPERRCLDDGNDFAPRLQAEILGRLVDHLGDQ